MRQLTSTFFKPLFSVANPLTFFLGCSATMTKRLTRISSSLCSAEFPLKAKVLGITIGRFQYYITIEIRIGSEYSRSLESTFTFLEGNNTGEAFIFAHSKTLTHKLVKSLKPKLDNIATKPNMLHVHRSLKKDANFGLIQLFTGAITVAGISPM